MSLSQSCLREMTMPSALEFIADHLPQVTVDDVVSRFSASVEIRDARAFAAELQAFVYERVEAMELPSALDVSPAVETTEQALTRKAAALRSDIRWVPGETDIQRGRTMLLEAFDQPHNLPLPVLTLHLLYRHARTPRRTCAPHCPIQTSAKFSRRSTSAATRPKSRARPA